MVRERPGAGERERRSGLARNTSHLVDRHEAYNEAGGVVAVAASSKSIRILSVEDHPVFREASVPFLGRNRI